MIRRISATATGSPSNLRRRSAAPPSRSLARGLSQPVWAGTSKDAMDFRTHPKARNSRVNRPPYGPPWRPDPTKQESGPSGSRPHRCCSSSPSRTQSPSRIWRRRPMRTRSNPNNSCPFEAGIFMHVGTVVAVGRASRARHHKMQPVETTPDPAAVGVDAETSGDRHG